MFIIIRYYLLDSKCAGILLGSRELHTAPLTSKNVSFGGKRSDLKKNDLRFRIYLMMFFRDETT